jgi:triosephosphate isomerase
LNMVKIVVGNWKMNGSEALADALVPAVARFSAEKSFKGDIVLCPPAVLIPKVVKQVQGSFLAVGAQDVSAHEEGAYTGDIAASMLKDAGCRYVIVGHSERRAHYKELNEQVKAKALAAQQAGLIPIICVGEMQAQRDAGLATRYVTQQVRECVPAGGQFLLAYEPVWAIGSGKVPSSADIAEIHQQIQALLPGVSVLYGGSVKAANAREIMATPGVAGVLVGGASLNCDEFCGIIAAAEE